MKGTTILVGADPILQDRLMKTSMIRALSEWMFAGLLRLFPFVLVCVLMGFPQPSVAQTLEQYYQTAVAYFQRGQYDEALNAFSKVIEIDPKNALAYTSRGLVRYKLGDLDGALADHNKAIQLDPALPEAYTNRGGVRLAQGDEKGALADHSKAIELNPKSAEAYSNRGLVKLALGDPDGAIVDFDKALKLDPFYPNGARAYTNRATAYVQKANVLKGAAALGELRKAVKDSTNALVVDPKLAEAHNIRGLAFMKTIELNPQQALVMGIQNQALADFASAMEINPDLALPYLNRGILWVKLDRFPEALADLNKAVELQPKLRTAATPWIQWAESKQNQSASGQTQQ